MDPSSIFLTRPSTQTICAGKNNFYIYIIYFSIYEVGLGNKEDKIL